MDLMLPPGHSRTSVIAQLEGLFQIPEKHMLSRATNHKKPKSTTSDQNSVLLLDSFASIRSSLRSTNIPGFIAANPSTVTKAAQTPIEHAYQDVESYQQLTGAVIAIRGTWAALEATRGIEKPQMDLQLITELSCLISTDGCALFEYHISHLLTGSNHALRMNNLWTSLSASQKAYWRQHSSKFQLPLAFEYCFQALRNLETEDHEQRYSSIVRRAKKILETATIDSEGFLIASRNWGNPVPEHGLQLWKLGQFASSKKIQTRLSVLRTSSGHRFESGCRDLARFVGGAGWKMFSYHGIPRIEAEGEQETMAKLNAIWNGMTADDRLYWMELTGSLLRGLMAGQMESLVYFSFDAWAVQEARQSAQAWRRLLV